MQYRCVCQRFRAGSEQELYSVLEDNPELYDDIEYIEDDIAFSNSLEKEKDRVEENEMFKHRS
jgi:hypothetical protein